MARIPTLLRMEGPIARRRRRIMNVSPNATQDVSPAQHKQLSPLSACVSCVTAACVVAAVLRTCFYGTAQLSMAPWRWLAKNDLPSVGTTFMPLCFRLVIAPAFNVVNMWVDFLLSVISA